MKMKWGNTPDKSWDNGCDTHSRYSFVAVFTRGGNHRTSKLPIPIVAPISLEGDPRLWSLTSVAVSGSISNITGWKLVDPISCEISRFLFHSENHEHPNNDVNKSTDVFFLRNRKPLPGMSLPEIQRFPTQIQGLPLQIPTPQSH